jgi:hypothetical protein
MQHQPGRCRPMARHTTDTIERMHFSDAMTGQERTVYRARRKWLWAGVLNTQTWVFGATEEEVATKLADGGP